MDLQRERTGTLDRADDEHEKEVDDLVDDLDEERNGQMQQT